MSGGHTTTLKTEKSPNEFVYRELLKTMSVDIFNNNSEEISWEYNDSDYKSAIVLFWSIIFHAFEDHCLRGVKKSEQSEVLSKCMVAINEVLERYTGIDPAYALLEAAGFFDDYDK